MKVSLILLVLIAGVFESQAKYIYRNIFSEIPKCSRNDAYLDECLSETVMYIKENLRYRQSVFGVPALDPFSIDRIHKEFDGINFKAWNIQAYGAMDFNIEKFKLQLTKTSFDLKVTVVVPELVVTGYHKSSKEIYFWSIDLEGDFKVAFTGIKVVFEAEGKLFMENDSTYLNLQMLDSSISIQDAHIRKLDGGIKANYVKGKFEDEKRSILRSLCSAVNEQGAFEVKNYIQKALKNYPLELVVV